VFLDKENYEKAIIDFNTALKSDIKDVSKGLSYTLRGIAFLNQGEIEKAKSDFDNAIRINPGDGDAYTSRAIVYINQEKGDKAQADLNKALELNHENTTALNLRASVYTGLGEIDKAKEDLDKAISLNPENIDELKESRAKLDSPIQPPPAAPGATFPS
jgi:tetratricopeptide (TPR) repeat protein